MLIPLFAAEVFLRLGRPRPVNLKFLIEGEEETGSPHVEAVVASLKDKLAADIVISADGAMWR